MANPYSMLIEDERPILKISARLPNSDIDEEIFSLVNDGTLKILEKNPEDERIFNELQRDIKSVAVEKGVQLTTTHVLYSLVEPEKIPEELKVKNTLVEATLPYCLHLPNDYAFNVKYSDDKIARIIVRKVWTVKAKGSSSIDFFARDRILFFNGGVLTTCKFPVEEAPGWQQDHRVENMEKEKDLNGTFRYTKLFIQTDTSYRKEDFEKSDDSKVIIGKVSSEALEVTNRLIDAYRYITKQSYVVRIGSLNINNIYFFEARLGVYISSIGHGIGSAVMNRSKKEINLIEKNLKMGVTPPLFELLMLDAEANFDRNSFNIAVEDSCRALEVFIENFLINGYKRADLTDQEIQKILDSKWRIRGRIKDLVKDISGYSLVQSVPALWQRWNTLYDDVRNVVVHLGKQPSPAETREVLDINKKIISLLVVLPDVDTGIKLSRKILYGKGNFSSRIKNIIAGLIKKKNSMSHFHLIS